MTHSSKRTMILFAAALAGATGAAPPARVSEGELSEPESAVSLHDLRQEGAAGAWHLGMPLANGEIGAMVWGDGQPLVITLDHYDLRDSRTWRPDPLRYSYERWRELIGSGRAAEIREEFEARHHEARDRGEVPSPTRLPLGRLEVRLGAGARIGSGNLRLSTAEGILESRAGEASGSGAPAGVVRVLVHATRPIVLAEIEGPAADASWSLAPAPLAEADARRLSRLGYEAPTVRDEADGWPSLRWGYGGDREAIVLARGVREIPGRLTLVATIRTGARSARRPRREPAEAPDELVRAARREIEALGDLGKTVRDELVGAHRSWWRSFWDVSAVRVPEPAIEALWYRGLYQLASLSRPGKHPVSLQGVWTPDGRLPRAAGEYRLDGNLEMSYWAVLESNHVDLADPLHERFFANLPRYRRMSREFFGFDGCYTRCEQALDGSEVFGSAASGFWAGNGPWLAHHFWLRWKHTLDFEFLARRAYPFLRSCMDLYLGLLEKGEDGYWHLPVTCSPEFQDGSDLAWGRDDAGNLALVRFLCEALLEADRILGENDPARDRWRDVLASLAPLPGTSVDPATGEMRYPPGAQGGIHVLAGRPYDAPHRRMTHLLAIYPLCLLRRGESPEMDRLLDDSLDNVLRRSQPIGDWAGWTFPWVSLLAGRAGKPEVAVEMLRRFSDAHLHPNGLHENGDWRGVGTTRLRHPEPDVTVDGSLAAAAAVQDLLLQSDGGTIRLFPATPASWRDASFRGLRAEGAFVVSARRAGGTVARVRILSEKGGTCRLQGLGPAVKARIDGGPEVPVEVRRGISVVETSPGATYLLETAGRPPAARPSAEAGRPRTDR